MRHRIGIDVGGTFTDLFVWSEGRGVETFKVLSTPQDPSIGVIDGLRAVAAAFDLTLSELAASVDTIVHGTTVTTNAVLTRGGGRTALLTTKGVRDALEMRRGIREQQYDNRYLNVAPLVPRRLRQTIAGRLDWRGAELSPLDVEAVAKAIEGFRRDGIEAVAICFMNAFANPDHERAAAEVVRKTWPEVFLSVSSEVLPTIRFYNRTSTTVLNAYVGPVLSRYLGNLTEKLAGAGFQGVLLIMQSNGGVATPELTARLAANTLLSGPAAGPRAGAAYAQGDCIVVDMGGTSFDASLVQGGQVALNMEGDVDRLRIALPMLAITTIGAGGGSIGRIDEGGLLRMGPQSAGALPGPACYGLGGTLPTSTDAALVLGYLDPAYFAGGQLRLHPELARAAIEQHVAKPLGLDVEEAAAGMYRVINANMAHGVREVSVKRGLDPREFPLVVAGGAGPVHGCMIAAELEMPTIVVPPTASCLCATGMLLSDLQHDAVRSYVTPLAAADPARLAKLVAEMIAWGQRQLSSEGIAESKCRHEVAFDLRYLKQYHEVTVPVAWRDGFDEAEVSSAFHARHNRLYGYDLAAAATGLELINLRVRSTGQTPKPTLPLVAAGGEDAGQALKGRRRAYVPESQNFVDLPVYDGHLLVAGNLIAGPALIERTDTTIVVAASFSARVDAHGSVVLATTAGGRA